MKHVSTCILSWVVALTLLAALPATACPRDLPAGLRAAVVGQDVVVNGLALSMAQVSGRDTAAAVLERTATAWRAAGYDVRRSSLPGWDVLAALGDTCMTTLQLTDKGRAFGYLAIGKPAAASAEGQGQGQGMSVPVPPGAAVLSSVASRDDGRRGTLTALTSGQTPEQLNAYYMRRLTREHWRGVSSRLQADRSRRLLRAVVSAQRGRQRIDVVIWRAGSTHALVNLADAL
jgi:hypothetical protein